MITASLKNYRQSPRKVRLVANLVRGKSAAEAINMLAFLPKKATGPLGVLLESALANAKNNFNLEREGLIIKEIRIDTGVTMKRSMPRARGTAYPINKRTSNVILVLAPVADNKMTKKAKYQAAKAKRAEKIAKK